jgi:hypothetical protein
MYLSSLIDTSNLREVTCHLGTCCILQLESPRRFRLRLYAVNVEYI